MTSWSHRVSEPVWGFQRKRISKYTVGVKDEKTDLEGIDVAKAT